MNMNFICVYGRWPGLGHCTSLSVLEDTLKDYHFWARVVWKPFLEFDCKVGQLGFVKDRAISPLRDELTCKFPQSMLSRPKDPRSTSTRKIIQAPRDPDVDRKSVADL